jgi:hypothetical protein
MLVKHQEDLLDVLDVIKLKELYVLNHADKLAPVFDALVDHQFKDFLCTLSKCLLT